MLNWVVRRIFVVIRLYIFFNFSTYTNIDIINSVIGLNILSLKYFVEIMDEVLLCFYPAVWTTTSFEMLE